MYHHGTMQNRSFFYDIFCRVSTKVQILYTEKTRDFEFAVIDCDTLTSYSAMLFEIFLL